MKLRSAPPMAALPLLLLSTAGAIAPRALAQAVDEKLWVANGPVKAIVTSGGFRSGDKIYIGGEFTQVGPSTGGGAPLDPTTGQLPASFPRVAGTVYAVAPDGSNGWFIGGDFTSVGKFPRSHLAHILGDLSVDSWDPQADAPVRALVVSGSKLIVGGNFTSIGGQPRNYIAALDLTSGLATSWNPNAGFWVTAFALNGSTVYVGGGFSSIAGVNRNGLAEINLTTGSATGWNPNASGSIDAIVVGASVVYVAGSFSLMGGVIRNNIAALDGSTGALAAWNPNANSEVKALVVSGSTVYASGLFTSIGGQPRNRIAALSASTGLAASWNPNADAEVSSLLVSGSKVYAGGRFSSIGGATRYCLASLDATTGLADSWDPHGGGNAVYALASNGSALYAGGDFVTMNAKVRNHLACLDATIGAATSWDPNADNTVSSIVVSGDSIYVGGSFTSVGGQPRLRLARVDATGAVTSWNPGANNTVNALTLGPGRVFVVGAFTNIAGSGRNRAAAVDPVTAAALPWNPNANGPVNTVYVDGNNAYLGGAFTSIGGTTRNRIALVSATGAGALQGWNPSASDQVSAIAVSGSTVYAGGEFTSIGGASRGLLASLDASGVATSWDPEPNGAVAGLAVDGSRLYVAGSFNFFAMAPAQTRNAIAAFEIPSGALTAWNPNANLGAWSLFPSGSTVYACGYFTTVQGDARARLVALQAAPEISAVQPSSGGNSGSVTISITGRHFASGATVSLQQTLPPGLLGASAVIVAADGNSLTANVDLTGAPTGAWDVVMTNPDLQTATLANGFTITSLLAPQLELALLGPEPIRANYPTAFDLVIENPGNVDAIGVPVWITGIPASGTLTEDFVLSPPPQAGGEPDWSAVPSLVTTGSGQAMSFVIPRVPPGSMRRRFILSLPPSVTQFQLGAAITPGWTADPAFLACLNTPALIQNPSCTGPTLTSIDAYLAANPQLEAVSGMGIWAKEAWQCEGATDLTSAQAKAAQVVGYLESWTETSPPPAGCEDAFLPIWRPTRTVHVVSSIDPNDKLSPAGSISSTQAVPYSIRFENLAQASASARQVTVVDQLATSFDLNSLSLDAIDLFGTVHLLPPPGSKQYTHDVDLGQNNLMVRVSASLDIPSRQLTWLFTTLDKATLQPPSNPLYGFLPPNVAPPQGEGSVLFTIKTLASTPNGTPIQNSAVLNFDGSGQTTPVVANTLDNAAPASNVLALSTPISATSFPVSWAASGAPADLKDFTIYVSEDGNPYQAWRLNTTRTSDTYVPKPGGHAYYFYSVARDQSGNIENAPASPDAQTQSTTAVDGAFPTRLVLAGARPNPAHGVLRIAFALPSTEPATLELIDVAGRRIARRDVGALGPGEHELGLGSPHLKAGLYFVRLTQAGEVLNARVVLMR